MKWGLEYVFQNSVGQSYVLKETMERAVLSQVLGLLGFWQKPQRSEQNSGEREGLGSEQTCWI